MDNEEFIKYKTEHKQMQKDIGEVKGKLDEYIDEDREWKENFFEKIDDRFVHKTRFETLQKVVYGSIGVMITLIGGTIAFTIEIILDYNLL